MIRNVKGELVKVFFLKYGRLMDFCYVYGKLGHVIKYCSERDEDAEGDEEIQGNFGMWLRVAPLRKNLVNQGEEANRGRNVNEMLFKAYDGKNPVSNESSQ